MSLVTALQGTQNTLFESASLAQSSAKKLLNRETANTIPITALIMWHDTQTHKKGGWSVDRTAVRGLNLTSYRAADVPNYRDFGAFPISDDAMVFPAQTETPESYMTREAERNEGKAGRDLSKAQYYNSSDPLCSFKAMSTGDFYASTTSNVKFGSEPNTLVLATLNGVKLKHVYPRPKKELGEDGQVKYSDEMVSIEFGGMAVLDTTTASTFGSLVHMLPNVTRLLPLGVFGNRTQLFAVDGILDKLDCIPGGKYGHFVRPTEPALPGDGASEEDTKTYEAALDLYNTTLEKYEAAHKEPYVVTLAIMTDKSDKVRVFEEDDVVIKSVGTNGDATGDPDVPGMTLEFFHIQNLPGCEKPCNAVIQVRLFQHEMAKLGACTTKQWKGVLRYYVPDIVSRMTGLARVLNPKSVYEGTTKDLGCAPVNLNVMTDFTKVLTEVGFKVNARFIRDIVFAGQTEHESVEEPSTNFKFDMQSALNSDPVRNLHEVSVASIEAAYPDGISPYDYYVLFSNPSAIAKKGSKREKVLRTFTPDELYQLFTTNEEDEPNKVEKDGAMFMIPNVDDIQWCAYSVKRSADGAARKIKPETVKHYADAFGNVDLEDTETYMTVKAVKPGETRAPATEEGGEKPLDWNNISHLPPMKRKDGEVDETTGRWVHKSLLMITDGKGTKASGGAKRERTGESGAAEPNKRGRSETVMEDAGAPAPAAEPAAPAPAEAKEPEAVADEDDDLDFLDE